MYFSFLKSNFVLKMLNTVIENVIDWNWPFECTISGNGKSVFSSG